MYEYRVKKLISVVDGDTIDVIIDLGFDILFASRVRLAGIDTPESRTTDEYEKKYTPCNIDYNYNGKSIPLYKSSHFEFASTFIPYKETHIGYLNEDNVKVTYTNIKNGECLIMTKHLMHRGDLKRKGNVKGFNFRVLIKNKDGSIDYNKYYKPSSKFPNHKWDKKNKKLYGVDLFDFA